MIKELEDTIRAIVESTYPNLQSNMDGTYFHDRAILAATNAIVSEVNDYVLSQIKAVEKVYLSLDSVDTSDGGIETNNNEYSLEFFNTIKCSGIPNHELKLKIGAPVILLRNIDQAAGLCNGTRLIVN